MRKPPAVWWWGAAFVGACAREPAPSVVLSPPLAPPVETAIPTATVDAAAARELLAAALAKGDAQAPEHDGPPDAATPDASTIEKP